MRGSALGRARVRLPHVLDVVEERLTVAKRQTEGGRVRVRSYVVETPIEHDVELRSERVHVERRAVEEAFGLAPDDGPIFCVISRLTGQKGMDLVVATAHDLVDAGVIFGTGFAPFRGLRRSPLDFPAIAFP